MIRTLRDPSEYIDKKIVCQLRVLVCRLIGGIVGILFGFGLSLAMGATRPALSFGISLDNIVCPIIESSGPIDT
jgi:hypothetical protein